MLAKRLALFSLVLIACDDDDDGPGPRDATVDASVSIDATVPTCALAERYRWTTRKGAVNTYALSVPDTFTVTRSNPYDGGVAATCSLTLPSCGDPRLDLGELNDALRHPAVLSAFATGAVFSDGPDAGPGDGSALQIEREDGKQVTLHNGSCDGGVAGLCVPEITPPLANLRSALQQLGQLAEQAAACRDVVRKLATDEDPGPPAIEFGPKADAQLFVDDQEVGRVFFTAVASNEGDRAHLFVVPDSNDNPKVTSYYVSLVLDDEAWKAGSYEGVLGGRARFVLADGRVYEGSAAALKLKLTTSQAGLGTYRESYLRGPAQLIVPSTQPGASPLRVEMQIN